MKIATRIIFHFNFSKAIALFYFVTTDLISGAVFAQTSETVSPQRVLLDQSCVSCHN